MQAEFLRDECNNIWFTYAKKIHFRRMKKSKGKDYLDAFSEQKKADDLKVVQEEEKDVILRELEEIEQAK
jgi:hypothetical protein